MSRALARDQSQIGYFRATRHPLVCVLFVLPLLLAYEGGMHLMGQETGQVHRNGADAWLRSLLTDIGVHGLYGAPVLLLLILLGWGLWRRERLPGDLLGIGVGMTLESTLFAFGLLGISQAMIPMIQAMPQSGFLTLETSPPLSTGWDPVSQQVLRYLGAGLYEETLFRLVLFSGLWMLFQYWEMPGGLAFLVAGLGSALCFAGAHHLGANGEPFHPLVFLFRTLAGWYFAWIFFFRGFGIAVGAHALYDVVVGVLLR